MISYYPSLIIIDGESGSFVLGESISYSVDGAESITWMSDTYSLPCTDCEEIEISTSSDGTITVTATDVNGCIEEETFSISVSNELVFPNYLTPNGDNVNDVLKIKGSESFTMTNLVVFNKWGQIVFEQANYSNDWSGVDKSGNQLPDGAYYYVLEYSIGELVYKTAGSSFVGLLSRSLD